MNVRRALGMCLVASVTAIGVQAAPPQQKASDKSGASTHAADEKAIVANEQKINDALTKGDVGAFKALVSADSWSVDGGGVMSAADFEKNFKQIKLDPGSKITDTKVVWIASNSAVLIYKWTGKGSFMGQPVPPVTYSSTVWHKSGEKWTAMFHQETAAAK